MKQFMFNPKRNLHEKDNNIYHYSYYHTSWLVIYNLTKPEKELPANGPFIISLTRQIHVESAQSQLLSILNEI